MAHLILYRFMREFSYNASLRAMLWLETVVFLRGETEPSFHQVKDGSGLAYRNILDSEIRGTRGFGIILLMLFYAIQAHDVGTEKDCILDILHLQDWLESML